MKQIAYVDDFYIDRINIESIVYKDDMNTFNN